PPGQRVSALAVSRVVECGAARSPTAWIRIGLDLSPGRILEADRGKPSKPPRAGLPYRGLRPPHPISRHMRRVIAVPPTLDERGFDQLVEEAARGEPGGGALVDARHVRWADPYGMVGLLAVGMHLREEDGPPPVLELPESPEVMSYL